MVYIFSIYLGKDSVCGKKTSLHDYGKGFHLKNWLVKQPSQPSKTLRLGEDDDTRFKHAMKLPIENPSRFKHRGGVTGFF